MLTYVTRIVRADTSRKSRFHTCSGKLVISIDMLRSVVTTVRRILWKHYADLPWITYPAIRYLESRLSGRRMFEFGSGQSTRWYATRCAEVHSVENNPNWYKSIKATTEHLHNVSLTLAASDIEFENSISEPGGHFGAIVIDCQPLLKQGSLEKPDSDEFRVTCLRLARAFASTDCIFIIDNTDAMKALNNEVAALFPAASIHRFPGWVPGILHPNETTIVDLSRHAKGLLQ
jgi:hypothetical protein